ncbi:MAG: ATP-binding cassette domain-containing protein, partial [Ignavibacteriae bacterium]
SAFNDLDDLRRILHDCALDQDLQLMPAGTQTEIGERGVNLSGGQKQRVSLARAVAQSPGIVFLDDPLSAVDVHTEDHLVERLLFGRWRIVTRIMVTHRLKHLPKFDRIVVLDRGRIVAEGSYDDVKHAIPAEALMYADEPVRQVAPLPEKAGHTIVDGAEDAPRGDGRITDDEDRDVGAVRIDVYFAYVRAMIGKHPVMAPIVLLSLIGTAVAITVLPILQTSWLGYWTDMKAGPDAHLAVSPLNAVAIYGVIGVLVLSGWLGERLLWLYRSASAGKTIHDNALEGVLAAPLRFFDSTPMGRVLNRFARDMEGVDDHLSWNFEQSFKSLSQTIGSLILIIMVLPIITVVLVPVLWIYYRLQRDYRAAAREAKRMESIARSPRYAHFKEVVTGLDVIHGYGRERFFIDTYQEILTKYQRAFYCSIILNRWFSVRIPMISGIVAVATSIGIVMLAHQGAISTGIAGIVLTYALSFWASLNWTVRAFSEVESRMTSVERLRSYGKLTPEPQNTDQPAMAASVAWP